MVKGQKKLNKFDSPWWPNKAIITEVTHNNRFRVSMLNGAEPPPHFETQKGIYLGWMISIIKRTKETDLNKCQKITISSKENEGKNFLFFFFFKKNTIKKKKKIK
jgi:hypothetical protein